MKNISLCFIRKYRLIGLLLFVLSITRGNAQPLPTYDYTTEIGKRLHPGERLQNTVEIAFFIACPSFVVPEYSLSVVEVNNKYYIRARILEKNLSDELAKISRGKQKPIDINTSVYSGQISTSFKDSLLNTFRKTISTFTKKKIPEGVVCLFDGTVFEFEVFLQNEHEYVKIDVDLKDSDYQKKTTLLLDKIINDLKNGSFDESKYKFIF